MRIYYFVNIVILLASKINCQVELTRELLEQSYGEELTSLSDLNLGYKEITSIDPNTFDGLTNLQKIWLDGNHITTIDPKTFNGLTKLQSISLFDNQLTSIDPQTFNGLTNLIGILKQFHSLFQEFRLLFEQRSDLNIF